MPARKKRRARGEGSVFKRADGLWVGQHRAGGRRIVVYGKTRIEAAENLFKKRVEVAPRPEEIREMTIGAWCEQWLASIADKVEPETWRKYAGHCRTHIKPLIGNVKASAFTTADAQRFIDSLPKAGRSKIMAKKVATTLSVAMSALARTSAIGTNPMLGTRKPRTSSRGAKPMGPDDLAKFLQAAKSDRLYLLYLLLVDSGARPGELYSLEWDDVNMEEGCISITKTLEQSGKLRDKPTKTAKSRRRVDLSPTSIEELARHRERMAAEGHAKSPHVFLTPSGTRLRCQHVYKFSFRSITEKAGVKLDRLYDLRHTSATLLLLAGEDSKVVAERLGHSTTALTQNTYQHVLPQMQKRAAAKIGSIIAASLGKESNHARDRGREPISPSPNEPEHTGSHAETAPPTAAIRAEGDSPGPAPG